MSATAVRESSTAPFIAPMPTNPRITSGARSSTHPSAVRTQPQKPTTKPPEMTGMRPRRSINRPAGSAASAPAVRKIAGPRPRIDSIPVTRTSVIVATATASCSTPESVDQAQGEQDGVTADLVRARHGRAIQPARLGMPARRHGRDGGRGTPSADVRRRGRRRSTRRPSASSVDEARARRRSPRASGAGCTSRCPGCVGTTFQSSTSSSRPSSASTRWTIVAVASAGPGTR